MIPPEGFSAARDVLRTAVTAHAFPAAVVEVGNGRDVLWREAFGALTWEPIAVRTQEHTIFDLASLTKVIATTTLVMGLVDSNGIELDGRICERLSEWTGVDREQVTLRDLLAHCAGLTAWLPLYRDHLGRADTQRTICTLPLEYPPASQSVYSDLGFMLIGFLLEDVVRAPLAQQFERLVPRLSTDSKALAFGVEPSRRARTAPTEIDLWRGRLLVGEVHDENAWMLGGAAGHSGLFGTASGVGAFARTMLNTLAGGTPSLVKPSILREFVTRRAIPGSSRALGWDTMLPTSSCGSRLSSRAFGHTGFTGTSLWIDPERGVYVVLLTNRVHPTRANDAIRAVRPALHDAVMAAFDGQESGRGRDL